MHRILVVEDEPLVYDAISTTFALQGGFDLTHASDGAPGLSMLACNSPDLALIDVHLPKVSGLEVAQYATTLQIPVILMSGHPDSRELCPRLRIPILTKPFRLSGLVACIDHLLTESARLRAELQEHVRVGLELEQSRHTAGLDATVSRGFGFATNSSAGRHFKGSSTR